MNANEEAIVTEACDWIARLQGREPSDTDRKDLESWMAQSPEHRSAIQKIAQEWHAMNVMTELGVHHPNHIRSSDSSACLGGVGSRSRNSWAGWAAAAFTLAVGFVWLFVESNVVEEHLLQSYSTQPGVQEHVTLPDGSILVLNSGSSLALDFSTEARDVQLLFGEVHFTVAKDASRPFRVKAGNSVFSAVGTAFAVRVSTQAVEITVVEGAVSFMDADAGAITPLRSLRMPATINQELLRVGDRVVVERDGDGVIGREKVTIEEMERKLAWRDGKVLFSGESMAEVVAELNRHTHARIIIEGDDLGAIRVGGAFDIGDVRKFLDTLQASFGLHVRYEGDFVFISSQSNN